MANVRIKNHGRCNRKQERRSARTTEARPTLPIGNEQPSTQDNAERVGVVPPLDDPAVADGPWGVPVEGKVLRCGPVARGEYRRGRGAALLGAGQAQGTRARTCFRTCFRSCTHAPARGGTSPRV